MKCFVELTYSYWACINIVDSNEACLKTASTTSVWLTEQGAGRLTYVISEENHHIRLFLRKAHSRHNHDNTKKQFSPASGQVSKPRHCVALDSSVAVRVLTGFECCSDEDFIPNLLVLFPCWPALPSFWLQPLALNSRVTDQVHLRCLQNCIFRQTERGLVIRACHMIAAMSVTPQRDSAHVTVKSCPGADRDWWIFEYPLPGHNLANKFNLTDDNSLEIKFLFLQLSFQICQDESLVNLHSDSTRVSL